MEASRVGVGSDGHVQLSPGVSVIVVSQAPGTGGQVKGELRAEWEIRHL